MSERTDARIPEDEVQRYRQNGVNRDQIVTLQASGADVLPKFASQAIRKVYDVGWRPPHFLTSVSTSVAAVLEPASFEKSQGLFTAAYFKDPNDPQWVNDPAYKDWHAFMKKYYPDGNLGDSFNAYGYSLAQTQVHDGLKRENIMQQVAHLSLDLPLLLPGIHVHTTPTDFFPLKQMHLHVSRVGNGFCSEM